MSEERRPWRWPHCPKVGLESHQRACCHPHYGRGGGRAAWAKAGPHHQAAGNSPLGAYKPRPVGGWVHMGRPGAPADVRRRMHAGVHVRRVTVHWRLVQGKAERSPRDSVQLLWSATGCPSLHTTLVSPTVAAGKSHHHSLKPGEAFLLLCLSWASSDLMLTITEKCYEDQPTGTEQIQELKSNRLVTQWVGHSACSRVPVYDTVP